MIVRKNLKTGMAKSVQIILDLFYSGNLLIFRWKRVFNEMSEKLQRELKSVQAENALLKMENLKFKTALTQLDAHPNRTINQTPN